MCHKYGIHITRSKLTPWRGCKKFGLRMSYKQWKCDYKSLLAHRIITELCYVAKALHVAAQSSIPLPEPRTVNSRLWSLQDYLLYQPFAKTNSYKNYWYYYPDSIGLWNQLPPGVCASPSLRVFKRILCALLGWPPLSNCIILSVSCHCCHCSVGAGLGLAFHYCQY